MRIIQLISTIAYGDAVSNDAIAMRDVLIQMGFYSRIYGEHILPPLKRSDAIPLAEMPQLKADDVAIYHLSTGTPLTHTFANLPCRKVVVYHNTTPPRYFYKNNAVLYAVQKESLQQIKALAPYVDYCMADSAFNRDDLRAMGYTCPIDVLPILIPFADYAQDFTPHLLQKYSDTTINVLYTGRIASNKKVEDILASFACYQKYYNANSRLFLAGNYAPGELYFRQLTAYAKKLGIAEQVVFTGSVPFRDIVTYYHLADVYLCMSEHEGFCVPLVEAMYFAVPIIAYASTAVPQTLGGTGLLLQDKNPMLVAGAIDRLMRDTALRTEIVQTQNVRLQDFSYETIRAQFMENMNAFLEGKK